jgi:hypothetical protein
MRSRLIAILANALFAVLLMVTAASAALMDPGETGFSGQSRSANYDELLNAFYSNDKVIQTIDGNKMWVPWYKTSSGSAVSDLQNGNNCNSGQTIDYNHNCMVTDEFSQVGIIVAMGKDQARMDQFYNTVVATKSTFGNIPAWRLYRDGSTIYACKEGINGNCDTASDATARIIIALYTAGRNDNFGDANQKAKYMDLAKRLSDDMLTYEIDQTCKPTRYGTVCHWLAGGSQVKRGGFASNGYAYTGYYADAVIAMLQAYAATDDVKYYNAAKDITLNYLQAAKFDGSKFTAPPGKAFKWTIDSSGQPQAECTHDCPSWDGFDAPRALGMCQANYYAKEMGLTLPNLQSYCDLLNAKHMGNPTSAPIQFSPDGSATVSSQSGVWAQGLQSLHYAGVNQAQFKTAVSSAVNHYSPATKTFDYAPSIGVYTQSLAVRSFGMGIGRDANSFKRTGNSIPPVTSPIISPVETSAPAPVTTTLSGIASLPFACTYFTGIAGTKKSDTTSGVCRTIVCATSAGDIKMQGCEKSGGYIELYRQAAPTGLAFKTCLANGCISKDYGFARFQLAGTSPLPSSTPVVTPPTTPTAPVEATVSKMTGLTTSANYEGNAVEKKSDSTDAGQCRTVVFGTPAGDIKIMGCDKGEGYIEVYRQAYPTGKFKACMSTGCVDEYGGYARVKAW